MAGAHVAMTLAHLAAAVTVGLWLSAGERAAWTLLALAARPVVEAWVTLQQPRLLVAPVPPVRSCAVAGWDTGRPVRSAQWDGCGVSRRGPPSTYVF